MKEVSTLKLFETKRLLPDQETLALVQKIELQITTKPVLPALPAIDYSLVGQQAPVVRPPLNALPQADVIIITWTDEEWAALEHVFCQGGTSMPYSAVERKLGWMGQGYTKSASTYRCNMGSLGIISTGHGPSTIGSPL